MQRARGKVAFCIEDQIIQGWILTLELIKGARYLDRGLPNGKSNRRMICSFSKNSLIFPSSIFNNKIMATQTSFPALLGTLTQALSSASESTEKLSAPIPPENGISLLDVKNELFLSYLQNLVFLIVLKLRNRKSSSSDDDNEEDLDDSVVKKLVELQVYLEKGVRPLEGRLKYQIDKVLRAADDAKRSEDAAVPKSNGRAVQDEDEDSESQSENESEAESENGVALRPEDIEDEQHAPSRAALVRNVNVPESNNQRQSDDGIYRPPRIAATSMPTTSGPREKGEKKPLKSATLDEFVNTELSAAPFAEPSIGTNTVSGGRRRKSERQLQDEAERKEYEERNYVRLPKESKKERAKKRGGRDAGYGGEEWRGLGEGMDRIERLTKRKGGEGLLEKSRKRAVEDGPRSSGGVEVGQGFQKRLKTLDGGRRDRGRK
jgi:U3 small nucleolar ribonucleoprotein protein LCP5